MKQVLTLLICLGAAASGMAQTGSENSRDVILGRPAGGSNGSTNRDVILGRDNGRVYDERGNRTNYPGNSSEVDAVNREYDAKIQSIRHNAYLSAAEKERAIRQLNADRAKRLKAVNGSYGRRGQDRDDDRNDDRYEKSKKNKSNNGNHYGWEKGKGNQRKSKASQGRYN